MKTTVWPKVSKRLMARILARLKKGPVTDSALYAELGTTLAHIYGAREKEPLIDCRAQVSDGYWDGSGNLMTGGYLLCLATRARLETRALNYRGQIRDAQAMLRRIERRLRSKRRR